MLSIANIPASASSSSYYEKEDYYNKENKEHQENSQWFGMGAKELGLSTQVLSEDLQKMLKGHLPNDIKIGQRQKGGLLVHSRGLDLTFSAPKSVSIIAEIIGDKRVYQAHLKAVHTALEYIEQNLMATTVVNKNIRTRHKTQTMVASLFKHSTSRNLDPQLHTHCLVHNVTKKSDGKWRSAELSELFNNKILLGTIYRTELAYNLSKLGYEIERTNPDSRFEVKSIEQEIINFFSSRSKEIKAALSKYNIQNSKTAENATIYTRSNKKYENNENLRERWRKDAKERGLVISQFANEKKSEIKSNIYKISRFDSKADNILDALKLGWKFAGKLLGKKDTHIGKIAKDLGNDEKKALIAVQYGILSLAERNNNFSVSEVIKKASSYGIGEISTKDILGAIEMLKENKEIIFTDQNNITTKDAVLAEKDITHFMQHGQNKVQSIYSIKDTKDYLTTSNLNEGQAQAVALIASTKDRIIGVQGYAGVGKTYMLNEARSLLEQKNWKMLGLAPSASAAQTLQNEAKIPSETLQRFIMRYDGVVNNRATNKGLQNMRNQFRKTILVVDESSMISTKQMHSLLDISSKLKLRVVLVGDHKQLSAVEAGKPFEQLLENKMKYVSMTEIIRQKEDKLKSAVYKAIEGNINAAFAKLEPNISENKENFIKNAANKWLNLSEEERKNTLVLAPSHKSRDIINQTIRSGLKKESKLGTMDLSHKTLMNKGLTKVERFNINNYKENSDFIIFSKDNRNKTIKNGDIWRVTKNNKETHSLILTKDDKIIKWEVPRNFFQTKGQVFEVFREKEIKITKDEDIRFTRNDYNLGFINSQTAKIIEVNHQDALVKLQDGKIISLPITHPALKHIDYAYSFTVHAAQGKTSENVIAVMNSYEKHLTTQKTFYVEISRAKENAYIYLDNINAIKKSLNNEISKAQDKSLTKNLIVEKEILKNVKELNIRKIPEQSITLPAERDRDMCK